MSLFNFGASGSGGGGAFGGSGGGFGASTSIAPSISSSSSLSGALGGSSTTVAGTNQASAGQVITLPAPPPSREALRLICMPAIISTGTAEKCFEEVRMDDYISFYQSTGRPPPPVPQIPTSQSERAAQGLPPLFEPQVIEESRPGPEELPEWQIFTPVHTGNGTTVPDRMQCVTAMPAMSGYSVEELRYYAYLKGRVLPPPDVLQQAQAQQQQQQLPSSFAGSATLKSNGIQFGGDTNETFLSITSKPEFALHSFEELRVAYAQAGRELRSNEILGATPASAKAPTLLIPSTSSATVGFMGAGVSPGGAFSFSAPTFKFS